MSFTCKDHGWQHLLKPCPACSSAIGSCNNITIGNSSVTIDDHTPELDPQIAHDKRLAEIDAESIFHLDRSTDCDTADEYQRVVPYLISRVRELTEELRVTDFLLDERQKVLDAIPQCPVHGECVPHALDWIHMMSNKASGEVKE